MNNTIWHHVRPHAICSFTSFILKILLRSTPVTMRMALVHEKYIMVRIEARYRDGWLLNIQWMDVPMDVRLCDCRKSLPE